MEQIIKGVIFDLDGTLADTIGDLKVSMNEMLTHYDFPHRTQNELIQFINGGARNFVKSSLPAEKQTDDPLIDEAFSIYNEAYTRHYLDTTYLYDGVLDTVTQLKANGIKLAVLSNKQHLQTNAIVTKLFGTDTFDIVLGHGEFPHKPDPAAVHHILRTFNVTSNEMLFVGDSDVDIMTALNSDIYPVGVSWGYRPPDLLITTGAKMIINEPKEILKLF